MRLIAKIGDRVLWQHDIWSTSRQTKQPLPGGVMGEGAFVADDSIELTDGRFTTVALPTMPQDAELWIYSTVETPVLVRILERRIGLYWRISSCYNNRLDAATQAAMTVGKANKQLTAIKNRTQPNTRIYKLCHRLQEQIIHGNDDGC